MFEVWFFSFLQFLPIPHLLCLRLMYRNLLRIWKYGRRWGNWSSAGGTGKLIGCPDGGILFYNSPNLLGSFLGSIFNLSFSIRNGKVKVFRLLKSPSIQSTKFLVHFLFLLNYTLKLISKEAFLVNQLKVVVKHKKSESEIDFVK